MQVAQRQVAQLLAVMREAPASPSGPVAGAGSVRRGRRPQHAQQQQAAAHHQQPQATATAATLSRQQVVRVGQQVPASPRGPGVGAGSASARSALRAGRQRRQRVAQQRSRGRGLTVPREAAAAARRAPQMQTHSRVRETRRAGDRPTPLIAPAVLVGAGVRGRSGRGGRRGQQQPAGVRQQGTVKDRTLRILGRGLGPRPQTTVR
jgi:hypothetical protein